MQLAIAICVSKKLSDYLISLSFINEHIEQLKTYQYLQNNPTGPARIILELCSEYVTAVGMTLEELQKIPFYNFGKRNRLKNELSLAENKLASQVDGILQQWISELNRQISQTKQEIISTDKEIAQLELELSSFDISSEQSTISMLRKCQDLFETSDYPDSELFSKLSNLIGFPKECISYINAYNEYAKSISEVNELGQRLKQKQQEIQAIKDNLRSEEEQNSLESFLDELDGIKFQAFFNLKEQLLRKKYADHSIDYSSKKNYRHKLFYNLLLCDWYYGDGSSMDYHIFIDEAQDLSKTEYILLRSLMGKKTVFNLYGDVNQLISDKGISDWSVLSDIVGNTIRYLNENYRNSLEITDFCNQRFNSDITGVGLHGKPVRKLDLLTGLQEIIALKKETPSMRTTVISKKKQEIENFICKAFSDESIVNSISIINVEEAKGLEFDAVLVVIHDMSPNEEYISYTRALDNLFIVENTHKA